MSSRQLYGGHGAGALAVLRRVCSFPPLWALIVALAINVAGYALPGWLTTTLGTIGRLILLLVIVALGVLFDARMLRSARVGPGAGNPRACGSCDWGCCWSGCSISRA